jgi:hypothetical protein
MGATVKTCKACKKEKPLRDFYANPYAKYRDGHMSTCMSCWKAHVLARYHEKKRLKCEQVAA